MTSFQTSLIQEFSKALATSLLQEKTTYMIVDFASSNIKAETEERFASKLRRQTRNFWLKNRRFLIAEHQGKQEESTSLVLANACYRKCAPLIAAQPEVMINLIMFLLLRIKIA